MRKVFETYGALYDAEFGHMVFRQVKIYWDNENEEYVCKLYIAGKHYEPADYFTSDREDAIRTASSMEKGV